MEPITISLTVLIILNIVVSLYILTRVDLDFFQKTVQIIMIWLIPFIGAIGLWSFNRDHDIYHHKTKMPCSETSNTDHCVSNNQSTGSNSDAGGGGD